MKNAGNEFVFPHTYGFPRNGWNPKLNSQAAELELFRRAPIFYFCNLFVPSRVCFISKGGNDEEAYHVVCCTGGAGGTARG